MIAEGWRALVERRATGAFNGSRRSACHEVPAADSKVLCRRLGCRSPDEQRPAVVQRRSRCCHLESPFVRAVDAAAIGDRFLRVQQGYIAAWANQTEVLETMSVAAVNETVPGKWVCQRANARYTDLVAPFIL